MAGIDDLDDAQRAFWNRFLVSAPDRAAAEARFFGTFSIGGSAAAADAGAALILSGAKTTTSDPVARLDHAGEDPPAPGSLSLLLDGRGAPVAVVETEAVAVRRFDEVDPGFARDYGEWDGTLDTWRRECAAFYAAQAAAEGWAWSETAPLVCEWMRVVFRD